MATESDATGFQPLLTLLLSPQRWGGPTPQRGAMKRFLDRLPRFAVGLGHVDCKYDDCRKRKRTREEVRAE